MSEADDQQTKQYLLARFWEGVLWFIGGDLANPVGNTTIHIPGFYEIAGVVSTISWPILYTSDR